MRSFQTTTKPLVTFAEGSSKEAGLKMKALGVTKALAVYDKDLYSFGLVEPILKTLEDEGIEFVLFDQVEIDCPDFVVEACIKMANENNINGFIGIGGGSTMDTVKAASVCRNLPLPISQYYAGTYTGPELVRTDKLVQIPTTAGTGAEGTRSCIIADTQRNVKASLISNYCKADVAILDPLLTMGIPPYATAITGIDIIAHATEALCCNRRNVYTHMNCVKAVELAWNSLPIAFNNGSNVEARSHMLVAAYLSLTGESYGNCGHSLAHSVGAVFHIPHGHCCAWSSPVSLYYTRNDCDYEIRLLAQAMGLDKDSPTVAKDVTNAYKQLVFDLGLKTPKEMGIDRDEFMAIWPKVMADPIKDALDTPLTVESCKDLLAQMYDQELIK